jgi:DNA-binding response OmpR family regulator
VKETILIVGEDEGLSSTRAELLKGWRVESTPFRDAADAIVARRYDLLIFCQTVPDAAASELIDRARAMNPRVQLLAISREGEERKLDSRRYEIQLMNPGGLRDAVASLLSNVSGSHSHSF